MKSFKDLLFRDSNARGIDISMIDYVQKGQMTKRFILAKDEMASSTTNSDPTLSKLLSDESTSLSIVYRTSVYTDPSSSSSASNSSGGTSRLKKNGISSPSSAASNASSKTPKGTEAASFKPHRFESLDLVIPSPRDYGNLSTALQDLIDVYRKQRRHYDRNVLMMQHHWVDMEKDLTDTMNVNEWLDLCNVMNVPLTKQRLLKIYRDLAKDLGMELEGLPLWIIAELMNDVRFYSMEAAGIKYVNQDPLLRLWKDVKGTDPVPAVQADGQQNDIGGDAEMQKSGGSKEDEKTISSVAFLSFIRSQQKEFKTTLESSLNLLHVLNEQISVKELALEDDEAEKPQPSKDEDAKNGEDDDDDDEKPESGKDRLNKSRFLSYLLSDANDLLDPEKGRVASDDMTRPLSHYWINTSHDTYLDNWNHATNMTRGGGRTGGIALDEQMYLSALYRGVRCLELDVWDGLNLSPVIARSKPKSPEDPAVDISYVLKAIRQFLLAHPTCYPVILNIENHCSFTGQENLADLMFQILGSIGLIVVPDESESIDESDLLPSPEAMKGKVLVMGKRPRIIQDGAKVVNDDFDDENMAYQPDELPSARSEEEIQLDEGIVVGFDAAGPIRSTDPTMVHNMVKHSPGELLYMAKEEAEQAKIEAATAELKAVAAGEEADKIEQQSKQVIEEAGLTTEEVDNIVNDVKSPELDPVEHVGLLTQKDEEGVEIQDFFGDALEGAKSDYCNADAEALQAAEDATAALQKLNTANEALREAEAALEEYYSRERTIVEAAQRGASEARNNREYADTARKRVETVRQLLLDCEETHASAQNVVNTAMTEAKISEKRASETEARANRASDQARRDRKRADDETKKEMDLERGASGYHDECVKATAQHKEAKDRLAKATAMRDRVNEQIKLIEQSSQYKKEKRDTHDHVHEQKDDVSAPRHGGRFIAKHAAKLEERDMCTELIKKATADYKEAEEHKRISTETFEAKAITWKKQADVAAKARRQADRSSHAAEELAEHADEEREAANLRHVARQRAQSNVSEKDSYKASLRAQLAEAERAAEEAERLAAEARVEADTLAHVMENMESHDDAKYTFDKRKAKRDKALEDYEKKKARKELAEVRSDEAKRLFDTSTEVFSSAMKDAAEESTRENVQKLENRNAIMAFNRARLARKQADHALEVARLAQSVVSEKESAIRRAEEYKVKADRVSVIPIALAKMTFIHTTKYRYWEKSLALPSTYAHSFSQEVLEQMEMRDSQNPKMMREFSMDRICRTFPPWKKTIDGTVNYDPIFQWSMGCQLVGINYSTFDDHVLKADGRFRGNGSCGYVLKPEFLIADDEPMERQQTWRVNVLCGSCLPTPQTLGGRKLGSHGAMSYVNPFVKITVYEGHTASGRKVREYRTRVVEKNGLNPVWDDKKGFEFQAQSPSMSILAFTVWDKAENGAEHIIGSASMPVSCIREGYRNVALFDMNNTRSGPFAYASLFVRAKKIGA